MAHFAQIDNNNKVIKVLVVPDEQEHRGQEYLANECFKAELIDGKIVQSKLGGTWIKTSYNTRHGKHLLGGNPLRKNYAGIGYTYDPIRDVFIAPKRYASWVLDEETCHWIPPIPMPTIAPALGMKYQWDETSISWKQVPRQ